ncbi:MAG TPA: hypothetical protein VF183_01310 [Acidimicrobiales bacterium]
MVAIDRSWCEALEEQRELERLAGDPACARRRRVVGAVRAVTVVTIALGIYGVVQAFDAFGVGVGLALSWALPMVILGIVVATEKLLVSVTKG